MDTFLSVLPPLIAIILAIITRNVVISLFIGITIGSLTYFNFNIINGILNIFTKYILNALYNKDHLYIILFSLSLAGLVNLIQQSGSAKRVIDKLSKNINNSVKAQLTAFIMGLIIFFDDYANTLIVGNTMRPLTDKLKVSREKLSYIVDSTSAPVAGLTIISTWIGFELSLISDSLKKVNLNLDALTIFIASIPFRFYAILALVFVFLIIILKKDLFSMHKAEIRARKEGKVIRDGSKPLMTQDYKTISNKGRTRHFVIPILTLIILTLAGLYYTGYTSLIAKKESINFMKIIINSNSFKAILWASFLTSIFTILFLAIDKVMPLNKAIDTFIDGFKSLINALVILTLAWALSNICSDLNTANHLTQLTKNYLKPELFPFIIFIFSAFISFATGSSWGTMAILIPITIPMIVNLTPENLQLYIIIATIGSVLSGATFGDHCSPISDTTILSSMASAVDHIDHVSTQMPYAILVAIISIIIGYIPSGFNFISPWILEIIGVISLIFIIYLIGKNTPVYYINKKLK